MISSTSISSMTFSFRLCKSNYLLSIFFFVSWISFLHAENIAIVSHKHIRGASFVGTGLSTIGESAVVSHCHIKGDEILPQEKCPRCQGKGTITCPVCNGLGYISAGIINGRPCSYGCVRCGGIRGNPATSDPAAGPPGRPGSGYIPCPDCNGTGLKSATKKSSSDREVQRQKLLEKQRIENEEAEEKQRIFEETKKEGLYRLKGVPSEKTGLKGVGTIKDHNTPVFGIKGIYDTGIKDIKPEKNSRDVSTAWKQLHCATEITRTLLEKALIPTESNIDINEVRYLADEATKALNGERLGVECSEAPPPPDLSSHRALNHERLQSILTNVVQQAEKINSANKQVIELKSKEESAKARIDTLKRNSEKLKNKEITLNKTPLIDKGKNKDDAITKAYEAQKAYQEKDKQRIEEVYKKQKENESAMAEAIAALHAAQKLINKRNAEKNGALNQLRQYQKSLTN